MSTSTHWISVVAKALNIPFNFLDLEGSFLVLHFPKKDHYIINTKLGLVTNTEEQIGRDKAYQYVFLKDVLPIPKTKSYLDPHSKYGALAQFNSHSEIVKDMLEHFTFPFILKKNQGAEGVHVFKVESLDQLKEKIKVIFNQQDSEYDHVLLAQEHLETKKEYRVVIYDQHVVLSYEKDNSQAIFMGNLSPLHWENAKAVEVSHQKKLKEFKALVEKLNTVWPVQFAGLDMIEDVDGKLWLIEVNTAPSFAHFIKDNGEEKVMRIYKEMLTDLRKKFS